MLFKIKTINPLSAQQFSQRRDTLLPSKHPCGGDLRLCSLSPSVARGPSFGPPWRGGRISLGPLPKPIKCNSPRRQSRHKRSLVKPRDTHQSRVRALTGNRPSKLRPTMPLPQEGLRRQAGERQRHHRRVRPRHGAHGQALRDGGAHQAVAGVGHQGRAGVRRQR